MSAGACLGTVANEGGVGYRVLVPPGMGGAVDGLRPAGQVAAADIIATVGGQPVPLTSSWPVRLPRPYAERLDGGAPLQTGQRVVDVLFPVTRGGTSAVPGGFGTGKTVLLQQITKWSDADVIVYVGCGERGNELADMLTELADLSDPRTGGKLAQRTVVIANTSNMPMMAREASIYSGAAVAEFFRDMGLHVVVVADSTSRWAEALREFSSRNGEMPAEEGYPAGLASALAAFYERAGRVITGGGWEGSITIIGAVSPAGGDMTEPVTAYTQRFVRCLWTLDRDLAYARHYPAISWAGSFCRDAAVVGNWHARNGDPGWTDRRARLSGLLAEADRVGELAELMGVTALPPRQRMTILAGRLAREGVLQQSAVSAADAYCDPARAAALVDLVLAVGDRCQELAQRGVSAALIEEQDFSPVLRAKEDASTPDQVRALAAGMLARLDALDAAATRRGRIPMGEWARPEFTSVGELRGPLLIVHGVSGVGWDEFATIRLNGAAGRSGQQVRHGLVLEADGDLAVRAGARGHRGHGPVGDGRRVLRQPAADPGRDAVARPGLQRPRRAERRRAAGDRRRDGAGDRVPDQPGGQAASGRARADRGLGDRRADDAGPGPEAADLLGRRAAAPGTGRPARGAGFGGRRAVQRGVRRDGADPRGCRRDQGDAGGALGGRRAGAAAQPGRRTSDRAGAHAAAGAHSRRASCVRERTACPGRDGRHDELLRGASRGIGGQGRTAGPPRLPGLPVQRPGVAVRAVRPDHGPAGVAHARAGA